MSLTSFRCRLSVLAAVGVLLLTLLLPQGALRAFEAADASTGLHDEADVLSAEEEREIEALIDEVEAAGAPTVVYLRLQDTEDDQAVDDARALMEEWNIESAPGARDGFVMFFNLQTDDPNRGEVGIVAGEEHSDGGALPQSELNSIRDDMIDLLAEDRMADGIMLGLERTAERLEAGPPEPTAVESFVQSIAEGPISIVNGVAVAVAALLGIAGFRIWQDRPRVRNATSSPTTELSTGEHPAIAGALADGNVGQEQVEATMVELARRGAITFEPEPGEDEKILVRLADPSQIQTPYEHKLGEILYEKAEDGVLDQDALRSTASRWDEVQTVIREELEERELFDPRASDRRRPLIFYGIFAGMLGLSALIPLGYTDEPWSAIAAIVLIGTALLLLVFAGEYPRTTLEGDQEAIPWRDYKAGLKAAAKDDEADIDLDHAFPYIVSFSLVSDFHDKLEKASEAGYVPVWFRMDDDHYNTSTAWFTYWIAFHGTMMPQQHGSTGTPGGAATGSGGAGGRF